MTDRSFAWLEPSAFPLVSRKHRASERKQQADSDLFTGVEFHGHKSLADSSHAWRFVFRHRARADVSTARSRRTASGISATVEPPNPKMSPWRWVAPR